MRAGLAVIRRLYRFQVLRLRPEGGHFRIEARMNPTGNEVDDVTVDIHAIGFPTGLTGARRKEWGTSRSGNPRVYAWAGPGGRRDAETQWFWHVRRRDPNWGHWQRTPSRRRIVAAETAARAHLQAEKDDYLELIGPTNPFGHGPDAAGLGRSRGRDGTLGPDSLTIGEAKDSDAATGRNFRADEATAITGSRLNRFLTGLIDPGSASHARVEATLRNGNIDFVIFLSGSQLPDEGGHRARFSRAQLQLLRRMIRTELRTFLARTFSNLTRQDISRIVRRVRVRTVSTRVL